MALFGNGIIFPRKGPWGGDDDRDDRGRTPWGDRGDHRNGRSNGGPRQDNVTELEVILRRAKNKWNGFNGRDGGQGRFGLGFIFGIIFLLWAATGLYRIQPSEHGVILTFGKWTQTRENPGIGYHLPWPIQDIETVDVAQRRRLVIGFRDGGNAVAVRDIPDESLMVTGDENIIQIHFVVLWNISDAGKYLFEIREPQNTIKKVAESAMREIIGRTRIQQALTESRSEIEADTRTLMQELLDTYQSGIAVDSVQLQRVDPPRQVVDAFDDVQRARADKERASNEADTYANNIVPRARGEAKKMLQAAEAYKESVISKAQGDAERFLSVYAAYRQAKDITKKRLYIETLEDIMKNTKKIIVGEGSAPVLPYLSVDALKKGAQ